MALRTTTKGEIVSAFRSAALLEAARRVFAARGFAEATIAEIAQAAAVAKGTLYLYYRSKQEIYWAALTSGVREVQRETAACVAAAPDARSKIDAFVRTKLTYFDSHRDFFRIYCREFGAMPSGRAQAARRQLQATQIRMLRAVLDEAIRRRQIRPVPSELAAYAVLELTRAAVMRRLVQKAPAALDDDVAFLVDLIWKGIRHDTSTQTGRRAALAVRRAVEAQAPPPSGTYRRPRRSCASRKASSISRARS